jgi:hypothetical protein
MVTCCVVVAKHRLYVTINGSTAIYANHYIHVTMGLCGRNISLNSYGNIAQVGDIEPFSFACQQTGELSTPRAVIHSL